MHFDLQNPWEMEERARRRAMLESAFCVVGLGYFMLMILLT